MNKMTGVIYLTYVYLKVSSPTIFYKYINNIIYLIN